MKTHDLKCWPESFAAILDGSKRCEVRVNDRDFAVGDVLHLREWSPYPVTGGGDYTGRETTVRVTHLVPGGKWGLPPTLCVMSVGPDAPEAGTPAPWEKLPNTMVCSRRQWLALWAVAGAAERAMDLPAEGPLVKEDIALGRALGRARAPAENTE